MVVLNAKLREGEEPLRQRIAHMTLSMEQERQSLQERRDEREKKTALFFRAEKAVQSDLLHELGAAQHALETEAAALGKRLAVHRAGEGSDEFVERLVAGAASVVEREALRVPLGSRRCVGDALSGAFFGSLR